MEETTESETQSSQGINIIQNSVQPTVLCTFHCTKSNQPGKVLTITFSLAYLEW